MSKRGGRGQRRAIRRVMRVEKPRLPKGRTEIKDRRGRGWRWSEKVYTLYSPPPPHIFPLTKSIKLYWLKLNWFVIYHWRRQPYFFLANLHLKQGIGKVYAIVDFICMRLLDLWEAQTENYNMKNSYISGIRTRDLLDEISIEHLGVDRVFPECAI